MTEYIFAYPWMGDFVNFKKASQSLGDTYYLYLKAFSRFCITNYPDMNLTQDIVDVWCKQRITENNAAWKGRIHFVRALLKYGNTRNHIDIKLPSIPAAGNVCYKPHAFTTEELKNLFYACDTIEIVRNRMTTKSRKIMMPLLFRLLYSTGMRTIEVLMLRSEDIDLESGIVNIRKSKNHNQHYIVLHESMLELVKKYNKDIEKLYPLRKYFFQSKNGNHFNRSWITGNFKKLWYKYNTVYARAYDLRHNYAVMNITGWYNVGVEFNAKLLALSKSMGHSSIKTTMYYYSLVPGLADKLKELTESSFNELIPEVDDDE